MSSIQWKRKLWPFSYAKSYTLEQKVAHILGRLENDPEQEYEAYYWIGNCYYHEELYEDANKAYLKALSLSEDPVFIAMIYECLATIAGYIYENDVDVFLNYMLKSLALQPDDENNLIRVGMEFLEREDYPNAEKYLLHLREVNPKNLSVHRYLGKLYEYTNRDELAEVSYLTALPYSSGYPDTYQGLGRLFFKKKQFSKSREMFIKANMPDYISAYNYYGIALNYLNEEDEYMALQYYHEALKLDPDYFGVYNDLAKVYFDLMGDFKKAKEYLDRAEELASNTMERQLVYGNLAKLHKAIVDDQTNAEYTMKLLRELGLSAELEDDDADE